MAASLIPADVIERLVGRGVLDIDFGRRFVIQQVLHAFERGEVMRCPVCDLLNVVPDHLDDKVCVCAFVVYLVKFRGPSQRCDVNPNQIARFTTFVPPLLSFL